MAAERNPSALVIPGQSGTKVRARSPKVEFRYGVTETSALERTAHSPTSYHANTIARSVPRVKTARFLPARGELVGRAARALCLWLGRARLGSAWRRRHQIAICVAID